MSNKPATKQDLIETSQTLRQEFKADLTETTQTLRQEFKQDLVEAVEAVVDGVSDMIESSEKRLDSKITKNHSAIKDNGRKIRDLQMDTPTQKEFDTLKEKVDRFHPAN